MSTFMLKVSSFLWKLYFKTKKISENEPAGPMLVELILVAQQTRNSYTNFNTFQKTQSIADTTVSDLSKKDGQAYFQKRLKRPTLSDFYCPNRSISRQTGIAKPLVIILK